MKCYNHSEVDAVAVCKVCGKGMCNDCLITIAGDSYCKSCVEAGKVKAPPVEVSAPPVAGPTPAGIPSKTPFIIGGAGSTLGAFASILTMLFGGLLFTLVWWLITVSYQYRYTYPSELIGGIPGIVSGIILAVALILAGIGYLGLKRNYGSGTGTAGFAFSIVVAVFIFVSLAFAVIALSYTGYYYANPWFAFYLITAIITLILLGVMQILWGAAHITTRQHTGNAGLAIATGIMFIISGALTMSIILTFVGIILFFVSEILATVTFLISDIPQQGTQTV